MVLPSLCVFQVQGNRAKVRWDGVPRNKMPIVMVFSNCYFIKLSQVCFQSHQASFGSIVFFQAQFWFGQTQFQLQTRTQSFGSFHRTGTTSPFELRRVHHALHTHRSPPLSKIPTTPNLYLALFRTRRKQSSRSRVSTGTQPSRCHPWVWCRPCL